MRSRYQLLAIVALLAGGLAGCGGGGRTAPLPAAGQPTWRLDDDEVRRGKAKQDELLSDGRASRKEYLEAVEELRMCLDRHDLNFFDAGWNPIDHRSIDFTFGNEAFPDERVLGLGNGCQDAYLNAVQDAYVSSSEPFMDPRIMKLSRNCLTKLGIVTNDVARNVRELVEEAKPEKRKSVIRCVGKSAQDVYPDRIITVRE